MSGPAIVSYEPAGGPLNKPFKLFVRLGGEMNLTGAIRLSHAELEALGCTAPAAASQNESGYPRRAWMQPDDALAMRAMLERCFDQFKAYEQSHLAKGTPDGNEKARTNAFLAGEIREVLDR